MNIGVVGAGAAGLAAATRAKRVNPQARVVVFEAGREFSRATCSLPYYLSGEISDQERLQGVTQQQLEAQGVELRLETPVLEIDSSQRVLTTAAERFSYQKLVVATGSRGRDPSLLGVDLRCPCVWRLRTIADAVEIRRHIETGRIRRVAVVGGGYVGVEAVEAFLAQGLQVALFHRQSSLMRLQGRPADAVNRTLLERGAELYLDSEVLQIECDRHGGDLTHQNSQSPSHYHFDAVLLSIGMEPETKLLEEAGARVGPTGAVQVSARGETSLSNIYACGDGVELPANGRGPGRWVPLATTAARVGRICGENAAGGSRRLGFLGGSLALRFFNSEVGMVGTPDDWTDAEALEFQWGSDHPVFPTRGRGVGLIFQEPRSQRLVGLQVVGPQASSLVDLFSLAMDQEMTLSQFQEQDFCYNPPLKGMWHPLFLASRAAEKRQAEVATGRYGR